MILNNYTCQFENNQLETSSQWISSLGISISSPTTECGISRSILNILMKNQEIWPTDSEKHEPEVYSHDVQIQDLVHNLFWNLNPEKN